MKNFLATTGVRRLAGKATTVTVLVGAMAATPVVAEADQHESQLGLPGDAVEVKSNAKVHHDPDRNGIDPPGHSDDLPGDNGDDQGVDEDQGHDSNSSPDNGESNEPPTGAEPTPPGADNGVEEPADGTDDPAGIDGDAILSFDAEGKALDEYLTLFGIGEGEIVNEVMGEIEAEGNAAVGSGELTKQEAGLILAHASPDVSTIIGSSDDGRDDWAANGDTKDNGAESDDGSDDVGETPEAGQIDDLTGATAEDLLALLSGGLTLADVAAEQGISLDDLVANLVAEVEELVATAVESGDLTQAQADGILGAIDGLVYSILDIAGDMPGNGNAPDECVPAPPNGVPADGMVAPEMICPMDS